MNDLIYIENMLSIKFPKEYKDFIHSNTYSDMKDISVKCDEEIIDIRKFLTLDINDESGIIEVYNENRSLMLEGLIPIAETMDDDYICLYYDSDRRLEPQIIQWIYDLAVEKRENGVFMLFHSFNEFILNLHRS